ncbi:MAG: hypothetical protein ACT4OZ_02655 [Gemmatimonadota bacterium]
MKKIALAAAVALFAACGGSEEAPAVDSAAMAAPEVSPAPAADSAMAAPMDSTMKKDSASH